MEDTESTEFAGAALRERMRRQSISVTELAVKAHEYPSNLYHVLAGGPVGPVRRARIEAAARKLGLYDDTDDTE